MAQIAGEGKGKRRKTEGKERMSERGREAVGGSMRGLWGCSHWPQTGTGVWIAHIGLATKLGWTSNLLCLWSFEEKRQLPTSCLPEWARQPGGSSHSLTQRQLDDPWTVWMEEGGQSPACWDLSFWIFLWNNVRRGKQQQQQPRRWRCRGNSVTFASCPGSDVPASGIRLEEMWVGEIDGYMQRQKYRGRCIYYFILFENLFGNQCLCWCADIDKLWCVVPCVCDDGGSVCAHICMFVCLRWCLVGGWI